MKDPLLFVKHIDESIDRILSFSKGIDKAGFMKDEMLQSAVIRQIEIIGEAVKNLPKEFCERYPDIPWSKIAKTRDKMAHHYFGVDLDLVYGIIRKEIPKIKTQIKRILKINGS